ncbi:MAG: 8-amino-7-oxononanoate synthase [Desulfobacteraceae bacterium]|nr:8-amino-7-oxononanoate synthase [Desulfobacteraceae bacterium]MBC2755237.1 8-amino-7-oxononanoate synthase [Desulfobacteraceae bacterium]
MVNDKNKDKFSFIDAEFDRRIKRRQLRQLRNVVPLNGIEININGRTMLNLCSNDYLGLSMHPLLQERSIEFIHKYGSGATASRLICGNYDFYEQVENKLAKLKQVEAALVLSSGFQANISVIPAVADRNSLILSDQLNHNSLIQGCRLSRCKVVVYRHNDLSHLTELLIENSGKGFSRILIVTESVFSMDGDRADLGGLVALSEKFNTFLIVDDAHATGVFGYQGMGLTCGYPIDLVIGTFGKAGGSFGAYLACSKKLRTYMINCCSGLIYTTALPPSVLGAIDAALDLIPAMDAERKSLQNHAEYLRQSLHEMGWRTGQSSTQIIPIIVGNEAEALALSKWLEENGILISAIRPPTVPEGASRIRLSLSALHTRKHVDHVIGLLQKWLLNK